jgi:hypothetical protein
MRRPMRGTRAIARGKIALQSTMIQV